MPTYDYICSACGPFEAIRGLDDRYIACSCGGEAERCPFSGIPEIKGTLPVHRIPDTSERWHKAEQAHKASGWDVDLAVRHLRKGVVEDKEGRRNVDLKRAGHA